MGMEQGSFDNITVLKFYADWCQPCRIYERNFNKVVADLDVPHEEINIDYEPDRAARYGVTTIPQTIVIRGGEEVARRVGAMTTKDLTALIRGAHNHV